MLVSAPTYNGTVLKQPTNVHLVPDGGDQKTVDVEIWQETGPIAKRSVRPGALGIVLAKEPAPIALREKRRIDAALLAARTGGEDLAQLPATAWEVASLAARAEHAKLPVRTLLGREASEMALYEAATSDDLRRWRYLHLATHGKIDESLPSRSAIVVTQVDLPDPLEAVLNNRPLFDGRVSVDEIRARWRLDADLVTLSACQTALGKYEGGEGFVGFTQALLLSGADTVCLSLWEVEDTATALLMDRFYANLLGQREGLSGPLPKVEALAEAQKWLRELTAEEASQRIATLTKGVSRGKGHTTTIIDPPKVAATDKASRPYEHPFYWAAFVLVGLSE